MKDYFHEPYMDDNRSMASDPIQQKSNQEGLGFEDNSPEAIQMRKFQANVNDTAEVKQMMAFQGAAHRHDAVQLKKRAEDLPKQKNKTGLPDNLKAGMENLSGISLDDVKVHRNSDKPAQLQAHAYAQGTDIHLGPGQEKHLPHEAWHVVQQKQGRVKPTLQMKGGVDVNDDGGLEREADVMGSKAFNNVNILSPMEKDLSSSKNNNTSMIQKVDNKVSPSKTEVEKEKEKEKELLKLIEKVTSAHQLHDEVFLTASEIGEHIISFFANLISCFAFFLDSTSTTGFLIMAIIIGVLIICKNLAKKEEDSESTEIYSSIGDGLILVIALLVTLLSFPIGVIIGSVILNMVYQTYFICKSHSSIVRKRKKKDITNLKKLLNDREREIELEETIIKFQTIKLDDYSKKLDELEASNNELEASNNILLRIYLIGEIDKIKGQLKIRVGKTTEKREKFDKIKKNIDHKDFKMKKELNQDSNISDIEFLGEEIGALLGEDEERGNE